MEKLIMLKTLSPGKEHFLLYQDNCRLKHMPVRSVVCIPSGQHCEQNTGILQDIMFLCQWLLDHCYDDMEFMTKFIDKTALQRLEMVSKSKFHGATYTMAVAILEEAAKVTKFQNGVEWVIDLAFVMKVNEDNKTVAAADVLVSKVGELIGGSKREENYDVLKQSTFNYWGAGDDDHNHIRHAKFLNTNLGLLKMTLGAWMTFVKSLVEMMQMILSMSFWFAVHPKLRSVNLTKKC